MVTEEEVAGKESIVLENASNVKLVVPFTMKNGFLKNVQNSTIFIHVVQGSCFFDHLSDCKLMMAAQQIRIHHTVRSEFYL